MPQIPFYVAIFHQIKPHTMQTTIITDILSEDFDLDDLTTSELGNLIEESSDTYHHVLLTYNREKRLWRVRVNEMITEYNDRRGFKIYNYLPL